jgi:hypothetical protein
VYLLGAIAIKKRFVDRPDQVKWWFDCRDSHQLEQFVWFGAYNGPDLWTSTWSGSIVSRIIWRGHGAAAMPHIVPPAPEMLQFLGSDTPCIWERYMEQICETYTTLRETVGPSQELGLLTGLDRNVPRTRGQVVLLF